MKKIFFIFAGLLLTVSVFSQTPWYIAGNAGTSGTSNFIGTTDTQPLVFRVQNTHAGYIQPYSNTSLGFMSFGYSAVGSGAICNTAFGSYALQRSTGASRNTAVVS